MVFIPIGEGLDIDTPVVFIPIGEGLDISFLCLTSFSLYFFFKASYNRKGKKTYHIIRPLDWLVNLLGVGGWGLGANFL